VLVGRIDAIADEHERRRDVRVGRAVGIPEHDVLAEGRGQRLAAGREAQRAAGQRLLADQFDLLAVAAAGQGRQAQHGGLGLEVAHGEFAAALARAAAFQQVVGEEGQVGAQRRFQHGRRGLGQGASTRGAQQDRGGAGAEQGR